MNHDNIIEQYPHIKDELNAARSLQESATSVHARAMYKQNQSEINSLIPQLIENMKVWDENKLRYIITRIEILRDEIISIDQNARAYDSLIEQVKNNDFDN